MQAIGTNLRRLRVRAGLTQDALAGMLHVTRQTVSSWEIGRTEPDLDTLLALAEALHCDATELIYGVKRNGYQQYQRRWIVCSMVCGVWPTAFTGSACRSSGSLRAAFCCARWHPSGCRSGSQERIAGGCWLQGSSLLCRRWCWP